MRILLIGDFSGLHTNLYQGLVKLGHDVTLASDGNGKNFCRDIDLDWSGRFRYVKMLKKLSVALPQMVGFDVVQLIGIPFLDLRPHRYLKIFKFLKKMNTSVFIGSNTVEFPYLNYSKEIGFKTSFINSSIRVENNPWMCSFVQSNMDEKYIQVHSEISNLANGITACCAEYFQAVSHYYKDKTIFLPLPYDVEYEKTIARLCASSKLTFFLGKQGIRSPYKGIDVIEKALIRLRDNYPNDVELIIVDSIPYDEYRSLMNSADVVCDQLYSYGAGLNAVIAMSKGLVVAGGGEEYMYDLFKEQNKPIVNLPDEENEVFDVLESILHMKSKLPGMGQASREFAIKHHNIESVAKKYLKFWESKM